MSEEIFERRTAFNAGEISPWLDPRIDQDKYHLGCRQMQNVKPTIYGGAFGRPGSEYLGTSLVPDSEPYGYPPAPPTGRVRLLSFEYEAGTTYVLELTHLRMRIWTTGDTPELVKDPDDPALVKGDLRVRTPWTEDQLNRLQVCQQNDLLFVVHPDVHPHVIARYAGDDWSVVKYNPEWPALLPENDKKITLQCWPANSAPEVWLKASTYKVGDWVQNDNEDYVCKISCKNREPGQHKEWKRFWKVKDTGRTLGIGAKVTMMASKPLFKPGHEGTKWVLTWRRTDLQRTLHVNAVAPDATSKEIYCLGEWSVGLYANNSGTSDWKAQVIVQRSEDNKTWENHKVISANKSEVQALLTGNEKEPCFLRLLLKDKSGGIPAGYKAELEVANRDQHGIVRIKDVDLDDVEMYLNDDNDIVKEGTVFTTTTTVKTTTTIKKPFQKVRTETQTNDQPPVVTNVTTASSAPASVVTVTVVNGTKAVTTITATTTLPIVFTATVVTTPIRTTTTVTTVKGNTTTTTGSVATGGPTTLAFTVSPAGKDVRALAVLEFPIPNSDETLFWNEPAWSDVRGFPRAVTLHEGRLWFGGTKTQPTTFWATGPDRYGDFRLGAEADRGLEFQVQSDEANAIQWMISHEVLVIGTTGTEWFYGERGGDDLPKLRKNSNYGSAPVQAKTVNESLVFIQRSKRKLREFAADPAGSNFACPDLTMLAEHFGDATFSQIVIQRNPETIIWIITSRGDLIGLLYERAQNVVGWFRYETQGNYESLAVVQGSGEEDQLWVVVKRTIGGVEKRYVERFQPDVQRLIKNGKQKELVYSDAASVVTVETDPLIARKLTKIDTPYWDTKKGENGVALKDSAGNFIYEEKIRRETVVNGLTHLKGMIVSALADGAPYSPDSDLLANPTAPEAITELAKYTVNNTGQLTIPWDADRVIVGLGYEQVIEPTYLETSDPGSITKAFKKRITRAEIEFWKTLGCQISADGGQKWHPIEFRQVEDVTDEVPKLFSGIKEEMVSGSSQRQVSVKLRQQQPLPMNLLSLVLRFTMGTA